MNPKVTFGFLAAALLAVGYLVWFDRDKAGTQDAAVAEKKMLPAARAGRGSVPIDRIEILRPDGNILLAIGSDHEWQMLAPVADRADPRLLRELVEALETSLKLDVVAGDPASLAKFGLSDPPARLKISRPGEVAVELQLGSRTAVEGRSYARLAGSPEVVVILDKIHELVRRTPDEFRDAQLVKLKPVDVSRVVIRNASGTIELERERGRWELTRPVAARADEKAVNEWIERLVGSGIRKFVRDDFGDLLEFGLAAPRGSVRLEFESRGETAPPPVELFFGNRADPGLAPDSVYVRSVSRRLVAAVPMVIEEALLLEADALRERTLFSLNPDLVDRVHLRPAAGDELVLARRGDDWTMLKPVPMAVESTEVMRLLKRLPSIRVRDFLAGDGVSLAAKELETPFLRVMFASFSSENTAESAAGETPIATVSFGRARPDGSVLVRVDEDNVMARVDADILAEISVDVICWQSLVLFEPTPGPIEAITVEQAGKTREFALIAGEWKRVGDGLPVDQVAAASASALLPRLRAVRWVGPALPAHGLDAPTLIVRARSKAVAEAIELRVGLRTAEGMRPAMLVGRNGVFELSDPDYQTLAALEQ